MNNSLALPINLSVGTFDNYLSVIARMPKLSAEHEYALAVRYRDLGDLEAAKELVMSNLRFVAHVARGYAGYGLPMADIVQEGNIGLMKAVKRFDPDLGVRLVSFAVHWIKAEIHEYVIKNWRIVKVATTKAQRKLFFNLRKLKKDLSYLSRDDAEAIAENLDVDVKTVYEMERRLDGRDVGLEPSDDDSDNSPAPIAYLEQQGADPALLLETSDWEHRKEELLLDAMAGLDERSRDILASRWLVEQKATLHELAERYQVSAERIRQLEQNAMKKLKAAVMLEA
ncbi:MULTISPECIES: RNA polymerase sigma factor RpoH [Methylomonas]|uniref:RNA polymerase sigma factor RpoH n=1 Tax=Methylomonas koyamae TaxID=702114 RepID=A0A177NFH9_9GAMM|nr:MULTISPECIES: RNA polymerase sigma factor RpoH [Methylomonas]NJA05267.1 RNA polymerase sigma factor RpoH [Methylococcaceae bacterium WWC4]OAI16675.1 RNA polymerase factor sigma-32 [Methylomonas koyamae]OHX36228.1 RNA polymerase factor sigma-32 [Methylomonas sp. LWB]